MMRTVMTTDENSNGNSNDNRTMRYTGIQPWQHEEGGRGEYI